MKLENLTELQGMLQASMYDDFLGQLCSLACQLSYSRQGQGIQSSSREADNLCGLAARKIGNEFGADADLNGDTQDVSVYIATELYLGRGGHTPLLFDLINADDSSRHELIITDIGGSANSRGNVEAILQHYKSRANTSILIASSFLQKILILRSHLAKLRPRKIVLMTHQYDVVAYCGLTPELADQLIWVHHADTFSLGIHIPWYTHVDLHIFAARKCACARGAGVFYWPLVSEDKGARARLAWKNDDPLVRCSHGTERKFEGDGILTYEMVVAKRLKLISGTHLHIGDLSDLRRDKIFAELRRSGIDPERFVYIGRVLSLWEYLRSSRIHLCISSHPVCGPRALVETKGCGIPILMFNDRANPSRSSVEFAYKDCLLWEDERSLDQVLSQLSPEILEAQSQLARHDFECRNSIEQLKRQMEIPAFFVSPGLDA